MKVVEGAPPPEEDPNDPKNQRYTDGSLTRRARALRFDPAKFLDGDATLEEYQEHQRAVAEVEQEKKLEEQRIAAQEEMQAIVESYAERDRLQAAEEEARREAKRAAEVDMFRSSSGLPPSVKK